MELLGSLCWSWADTEAERWKLELFGVGLAESEETEGRGIGPEELDLRTWTEDGLELLMEDVSFSRHNT